MDPEDLKFELPNTPLELEPNNSRVVGGLFPGKGFFYLPKTTCFDRDYANEQDINHLVQNTFMRIDHSETQTAKLLSSNGTFRPQNDSSFFNNKQNRDPVVNSAHFSPEPNHQKNTQNQHFQSTLSPLHQSPVRHASKITRQPTF
jgi:hypothetical protein